jgi:ATP-binding cassette subfamily B protein
VAEQTDTPKTARLSVRPLARLFPYITRYPHLVVGALVFLLLAAVTTLTLPMAVRRMIDHGFSAQDAGFINTYFSMLAAIAVILALASACRYYFVITLGERVVSDIRRDVFDHVTKLSAAFYDANRSGEIVSRLTADTTQIKSTVGATASLALRNTILCIGAGVMMFITSPKLSALVLVAIPVIVFPMVGFGRKVRKRSRLAQDSLAEAMTFAGEAIGATRTVQAFNTEARARTRFSQAVEAAFSAARQSILARSILTGFAIAMAFGSVVAVLWYGAQSVLSGELSPGTLGQFLLYSVFAAGSLGALSEVWGELSQAAGAAERLSELLDEVPEIRAPQAPDPFPRRPSGISASMMCISPIRPGLTPQHSPERASTSAREKPWRWLAHREPESRPCSRSSCASTTPAREPFLSTMSMFVKQIPPMYAPASPWFPRT